jgi:hypothetical protein
MRLSKAEIDEAIADPKWQEFRLSLKGQSTRKKLDRLKDWVREEPAVEHPTRCIQVQNYLNALSRGGQIAPVNKQDSVRAQLEEAVIRR